MDFHLYLHQSRNQKLMAYPLVLVFLQHLIHKRCDLILVILLAMRQWQHHLNSSWHFLLHQELLVFLNEVHRFATKDQ